MDQLRSSYKWELKEHPKDFGTWPYLLDSMKNRIMTFFGEHPLYLYHFHSP